MIMTKVRERLFGYDLLKALAMSMVVFYHVNMLDFAFSPESYYFPNFNKLVQILAAAGVPLFFMVNGALTVNREMTVERLMKKIGRLVFVSVIWTILLRIIVLGILMKRGAPSSLGDFLNYYWFFYSLAIVYVVNYLLSILPKWFEYFVVTIIFAIVFLNNFVWDIILFVDPDHILPSWGHTGFYTLYGIVYTRLGAYLKKIDLKWPKCAMMIVVGYGLVCFETIIMTNSSKEIFDGVNAAFPTLGAMCLSCGIFCLLKNIKAGESWITNLVKLVGRNSGGIYVFHLVVIILLRNYVFMNLCDVAYLPVVVVVIIAAFITIVCSMASEMIRRSKCSFLLAF